MKYYMAPMEGLTGYIYRNAYQKYFHDIDHLSTGTSLRLSQIKNWILK